jgi:hypothetical protein
MSKSRKPDFSGWATRNDIKCSDGRTIRKDAFKHCDGKTVPLVWNHQHNEIEDVLGHALLHNRDEGVYADCFLNESGRGQHAKEAVRHGDLTALSIFANSLRQTGSDVIHGIIREVSLVHAGANPGAYIDVVMEHAGMDGNEEFSAFVYNDNEDIVMHNYSEEEEKEEMADNNTIVHADEANENETFEDIFNTLNEKQKNLFYAMAAEIADVAEDDEEDEDVKHNAFDTDSRIENENTLSHSEMKTIINDGKRYGTLKESFLAHAEEYGIKQIDWLFPYGPEDGKNITNSPLFIDRDQSWVKKVMSSVHRTPFSRIKSMFADITADEARAKGYMKTGLKKEEVFTLLRRTTSPTTVYKKQKIDRDDAVDITDFDVVSWIKAEMRGKLDEELARAFLIGDGRLGDNEDKIKEDCIRPIWTDDPKLFVVNSVLTHDGTEEGRVRAFIRAAIKERKNYKGSGNPTLWCSEDLLTEMLLLTDKNGRDLFDDESKLLKKLRVKEIVTVPVMEGNAVLRTKDGKGRKLLGIIVNMNDYNVGADKGGAVNMFEDFDIDYNAHKYLIETRCSGALTLPFSAIVIEEPTEAAASSEEGEE